MSQATIHHPSSYGYSGQVGFPATISNGVSATYDFKGLLPGAHTITWNGGAPATNAITVAADGTASQAHTYATGTYDMVVREDATSRIVARRNVTVPYAGGAGFAPRMIEGGGENGEGGEEPQVLEQGVSMATGLPVDETLTGLPADIPGAVGRGETIAGSQPTEELVEEQETVENGDVPTNGEFDPADYTVAAVIEYAQEHPDDAADIYDLEAAGRNRTTLLTQLESLIPFDPGAYSVPEVVSYAEENPDDLEDIIAAEEAGKGRTTLLAQLNDMR